MAQAASRAEPAAAGRTEPNAKRIGWRRDPALRELVEWCTARGAKAGPIEPAYFAASGRGFRAKRDIEVRGSVCLTASCPSRIFCTSTGPYWKYLR
jgi:hypothetical protein